MQLTNDGETVKTLDAVSSTYARDVEKVSGYTRLIELINENESIIQKIKQQVSKIGYAFYDEKGNAGARIRKRTRNKNANHDSNNEDIKLSAYTLQAYT